MQRIRVFAILALAALPLFAQADFSGNWEFNTSRSRNIGMMSQMKLTSSIKQTKSEIVVTNVSVFNGKESSNELRLDLNGQAVTNKNPMEGPAETVTKWDGDRLVTVWTSEGSIAGTKSVRTETRYLSDGGRTLTVESQRGKSPAMVMVYERK